MVPSSAPPLVLVADDEPSMLELVARHLKSLESPKLEVIEASDGDEAWRLAKERLPDLVVLDVMMPGMSGWEVCRKIRDDVALAHTGVVMLTGIGENLNEMTSPLYGADAHIDKPFEFEELDDKVKTTLEARASQRELVPRPFKSGNGVGGPAKPASGSAKKRSAKKAAEKKAAAKKATAKTKKAAAKKPIAKKSSAKKATKKAAPPKKTSSKKQTQTEVRKGRMKMAAKKTAKKAAKKAPAAKKVAKKKTAKKAAKKK
jgi:DNA-binding response OmpR family regulator